MRDRLLRMSKSQTWKLDEVESAGRENLDPVHVSRYDDKEDSGAPGEVALLRQWGLGPDSIVVDLGAGTGQFTIEAARHCARVIAVDVSPVMLDRLRSKVSAEALDNVDIVQAGFLSYEHEGPPADIVHSRWALHHIPDFWKVQALARARRALRADGLLHLSDIVYSFEPSQADQYLRAWCDSLPVDAPDGEWRRADIEEHVRDEHSTYNWLLESMIEKTGFTIERSAYSDDKFFADYLARAV